MAIARDLATKSSTTGSSLTYSHTCTGSNLSLVVGVVINGSSDTITGVTYNGVAMTQVNSIAGANFCYLYYLNAPATGANNIVISSSASKTIHGFSASYTGTAAGTYDARATGSGSSSPVSASLTVVAAGSWVVGLGQTNGSSTVTAGGSYSMLQNNNVSGQSDGFEDSNGTVSAGVNSVQMSFSFASGVTMNAVSIAPLAFTLTAAAGSYALTGNSVTIGRIKTLVCQAGSYILTGIATVLTYTAFPWKPENKDTGTWNPENKH